MRAAMDERCDATERHCTCVPLLREKVRGLEGDLERLRAEEKAVLAALCGRGNDPQSASVNEMLAKIISEQVDEQVAEIERLRDALQEVAELSEYADRTQIFNHCKQAAEAAGGE